MSAAVEAFVAHGLGARYADLSSDAERALKTFILDTIGVGIAGVKAPYAEEVRSALLGGVPGGGGSYIWGTRMRAPAANAAFVNGFQIHCQEFDCVHEPAVVHPMATILSALMAECDAQSNVPGRELMVAVAVAVDVAVSLGVAATTPLKFFRPATAGVFGATLGICRLRGFNAERTRDALGHALAFCSGTMQAHVEGKPGLPLQIGNAARSAITACDLAASGIPGTRDSLEGPFGYLPLFEDGYNLDEVIAQLGRVWRIAEVSHKPFPTGRAAQGGIVLMQELRGKGIAPGRIERLRLAAPPLIKRLVGRPLTDGMTANYARLCFQYSGGVAFLRGTVGLSDFLPDALRDPKIHGFGRRIEVIENDVRHPAAFTPQTLTAELKNGERIFLIAERLYGSPQNPMSREANLEKFRACVAFAFEENARKIGNALIERVDALETLADSSSLSRLACGLEE